MWLCAFLRYGRAGATTSSAAVVILGKLKIDGDGVRAERPANSKQYSAELHSADIDIDTAPGDDDSSSTPLPFGWDVIVVGEKVPHS
jgi:hypothetical protein